jgi:hypothetical protein
MDDRACCCPSRPVVRVLMPAIPSRPYRVDLLLCGHHFRRSQWTLAAAGGVAQILPGRRTTDVFEMACSSGTNGPGAGGRGFPG